MFGKIVIAEAAVAILALVFLNSPIHALNAVASIKQADGQVRIERGKEPKKVLIGRSGLILNDRDIVTTGNRSKATILFRDGSEIRLFQKTSFEISQSMEGTASNGRRFISRILLKFGSFWGKFAEGKQKTIVQTPTVTAEIEETIVGFSESNGRFSAGVSAGMVEIGNDDERFRLKAGRMVENVSRTGSIADKIADLPYRLQIDPNRQKLSLPNQGETTSINFILQLAKAKTNENVHKSGAVYISAESDKITFPRNVRLNARGYARVQVAVHPFQKRDYKNGRIEITATMDGEDFIGVDAGEALVVYDVPKNLRGTVRIDGSSGSIRQ